jgi:hypothetical protein
VTLAAQARTRRHAPGDGCLTRRDERDILAMAQLMSLSVVLWPQLAQRWSQSTGIFGCDDKACQEPVGFRDRPHRDPSCQRAAAAARGSIVRAEGVDHRSTGYRAIVADKGHDFVLRNVVCSADTFG